MVRLVSKELDSVLERAWRWNKDVRDKNNWDKKEIIEIYFTFTNSERKHQPL